MSAPDPIDYRELPVDEAFEYATRYGVSDALGSEHMRFSVIEFDPGERGPLHYHDGPTEEYYMVLEGRLDVHLDGEAFEAEAGTVVLTPPETEHYPENNSDEPALLLSVSAPDVPRGDGVTVVEDVE